MISVRGLVLGHHQLELPGLSGLQTSKHGRSRPVLLERGMKLGSSHLVDHPVILELAEHAVLHTWTGARREGRSLQLLLSNHLGKE